jgi:hypothetical protein
VAVVGADLFLVKTNGAARKAGGIEIGLIP